MIAALLLLVVIVDATLTGFLFARCLQLTKICARHARLIKEICEEDGIRSDEPDAD